MAETIGERIKNLRLIRGYTQEELAEALNTSPSYFFINKEVPEQLKVDEAIAIINELYFFVQKSIRNGQSTVSVERQLNIR